jgi:hypothetical protein
VNALLANISGNAWRWFAAWQRSFDHPGDVLRNPGESARCSRVRGQALDVLALIQPSPIQLEKEADEIVASSSHRRREGILVDEAARPDHAGVPGRVLQPDVWDQCDLLFRPSHLPDGRARRAHRYSSRSGLDRNLVFTFVGLWLIGRLGRRFLRSDRTATSSLGLCSWAFFTHHYAIVPLHFAFIAAHAVGGNRDLV